MKLLNKRKLQDDFEKVYEINSPYVNFLKKLHSMAQDVIRFEEIEEIWYRKNGLIHIKISYQSQGETHIIWVEKKSDFIEMSLLFLINKQLNLSEYKFEYTSNQDCVYFMSDIEKELKKRNGVVFEEHNMLNKFSFMAYNVAMNLETEPNKFTYEMIADLAQNSSEYYRQNYQNNNSKDIQAYLQSKILEKINWNEALLSKIDISKLYELVAK
jgi:hypothetical protein